MSWTVLLILSARCRFQRQNVYWLPVECRTEYKIATICYSMITCTAPSYLYDLHEQYTPPHTLCSFADNHTFWIPKEISRTAHLFFHWSLHLEHSPFLCLTCSNSVLLQITAQDSPFICLLPLTLPTVSSLHQVNVCVAHMHLYWELGVGWGCNVWWHLFMLILFWCQLFLISVSNVHA